MKIEVHSPHLNLPETYTQSIAENTEKGLHRFHHETHKVKIFLSDENGGKGGSLDKKCVVEVVLHSGNPVIAESRSDDFGKALHQALVIAKSNLEKMHDKKVAHRDRTTLRKQMGG